MKTTPKLVNAWIYLNEDEPKGSNYNTPTSSYKQLIVNNVYQSVDILFICFAVTLPTSKTTIPAGNGDFYTLQMGTASHPGGLTNQDYMNKVIQDARKNNPDIKIAMTLIWGDGDTISNIFKNPHFTAQQNADNFAANLLSYLQYYNLDGFDVDWESPLSDTKKEQFTMLFTSIGKLFQKQAKKYYLTLSPAEATHLDANTVNTYFDFVTLQLYSGFTKPEDFTKIGIKKDLLAYGAKFESAYENAERAFDRSRHLGYNTITCWRLNSDNFQYEQSQQKALYKLVFP